MTGTCCGLERETPFCPECGKKLGERGPLEELLAHCRNNANQYRLNVTRIREQVAESGTTPSLTRQLPTAERGARKWERWVGALEGIDATCATMQADNARLRAAARVALKWLEVRRDNCAGDKDAAKALRAALGEGGPAA